MVVLDFICRMDNLDVVIIGKKNERPMFSGSAKEAKCNRRDLHRLTVDKLKGSASAIRFEVI